MEFNIIKTSSISYVELTKCCQYIWVIHVECYRVDWKVTVPIESGAFHKPRSMPTECQSWRLSGQAHASKVLLNFPSFSVMSQHCRNCFSWSKPVRQNCIPKQCCTLRCLVPPFMTNPFLEWQTRRLLNDNMSPSFMRHSNWRTHQSTKFTL